MLQLDLYIKEVFNFLRTCSIKIDYLRDYMKLKKQLTESAPIQPWHNSYYLHLNGCYAPDDPLIYITSLDTNTTIPFDRYTLKSHPKTLNGYSIYYNNYNILIETYPTLSDLIRNTIYPVFTIADTTLDTYGPIIAPITSLDDGTIINFDRVSLLTHPKTIVAYRSFGYDYTTFIPTITVPSAPNSIYTTLIGSYPKEYIDAVLYPVVEMDTMVTSDNLTLLNYTNDILHPNEEISIVEDLKKYLTMLNTRWHISEFVYEEYYFASQITIIFHLLALNIFSNRFKNIRTNEVHPLHITEYLNSHGLGNYTDILDNQQELFLYKNINYINKNKGKTSNLKLLADNLLANQGITLKTKSILQSTTNSVIDCETTPHFISEPLDSKITPLQNAIGIVSPVSNIVFREYLNKLEPVNTSKVHDDQTFKLRHTRFSYLKTKLITLEHNLGDSGFVNTYFTLATHTIMRKLRDNELNFTRSVALITDGANLILTEHEIIALICYALGKLAIIKDTTNIVTPIITYEGIDIIPTQMQIYANYKKVLPDISNETVWHRGSDNNNLAISSKLSSILDINYIYDQLDNPITGVPRNIIHTDPIDLVRDIDDQFVVFRNHLLNFYSSTDMYRYDAWDLVIKHILNKEILTLNLVQGHTTYSDWFMSNPVIGDVITEINNQSTNIELYNNMINNLIDVLYPINLTGSNYSTGLTNNQYIKMRQLFEELCSYNIAFIDSDSTFTSELPLPRLNVGNTDSRITEESIIQRYDPELTNTSVMYDEYIVPNNAYDVIASNELSIDTVLYQRQSEIMKITNRMTPTTIMRPSINMEYNQIYTP